jgi:uncharacterized integral membrane protein
VQIFTWLAFLVAVAVAVFAVQNSTTPLLTLKFLAWGWQTSLIYVMLISLVAGMLMMFFMWVPFVFRSIRERKNLRNEIEILRRNMRRDVETGRPADSSEKRAPGGDVPPDGSIP